MWCTCENGVDELECYPPGFVVDLEDVVEVIEYLAKELVGFRLDLRRDTLVIEELVNLVDKFLLF